MRTGVTRRQVLRSAGLVTAAAATGCAGRTSAEDVAGRKPLWHQDFPFSGDSDGDTWGSKAVVASGGTVYAADAGDLYAFDAAHGRQRWKSSYGPYDDTGTTKASAAVAGGTVITVRNQQNSTAMVYGIDAASGARRWQFAGRHVVSSATSATGSGGDRPPAVAGGLAYFATGPYLYALDAATGGVRWQRVSTGRPFHAPVVAGGLVVVDDDKWFAGFDAATGTPRWVRHSLNGTLLAGTDVVYSISDTVTALDARTGKPRWSTPKGDWTRSGSLAEALRYGGRPLFTDEAIYLLNSGARGVASMWALSPADGRIRWSFTSPHPLGGPLSANDGTVYCDADGGYLYAVDARSGKVRWTLDTHKAPVNQPAVSGGAVYVVVEPADGASDPNDRLYALPA